MGSRGASVKNPGGDFLKLGKKEGIEFGRLKTSLSLLDGGKGSDHQDSKKEKKKINEDRGSCGETKKLGSVLRNQRRLIPGYTLVMGAN